MEKHTKIGKKIFVKRIEYIVYDNVQDQKNEKILYKTSSKSIFIAHKIRAIKELLKLCRSN